MLRLSGSALHEAARHGDGPMTCLLALPEPPLDGPNPIGESFLEDLSVQAGVELDLRRSRVFRQGRAGGLLALKQAVALLAERREAYVLVGGVDSHLDFQVLAELDAQERLRASSGPSDSFIPGEGAAFVLLGSLGSGRRLRIDPQAHLLGVGTGFEQGHRLSAHPHLGEGLADAFRVLFASLPPAAGQIRCVYAGLNGESFWAKDWGVAYQRNARRFAEQFHIEHPVEFLGDPGAALGPLMVGLATIGVRKGYREAPCLVWCASDQGACAAALIAGIR